MIRSVERRDQKRDEAEARNAKWAALSFEQQVSHLDNVFGAGLGAAKQRAKIAKKIEIRDNASKKK